MERRIFLVICLSILVMYVYQVYLLPPPTQRPVPAASESPAATAAAPGGALEAPPATQSPPPPDDAPLEVVKGASDERAIVISTNTVEVEISNRGGIVRHWRLKDHLGEQGRPVDLIPTNVPPDSYRPFALEVDDPVITRRLNDALYEVSGASGDRVEAMTAAATVTMEFEDASGLRARKTFEFQPDGYVVTVTATVQNGDRALQPLVHWGPGLGDIGAAAAGGSFFTGNYVQPPAAIYHRDGDVERITAQNVAQERTHEGEFLFGGIDDHYFIATAVEPGRARLEYERVTGSAGDRRFEFVSFAVRPEEAGVPIRFFVGPKEIEALRDVHPQLVYSINFGIFSWIVVPLLQALKWLYGYIGNYGWSIIALTMIINLMMLPLRQKSLVSMRKMQLIQPQVKAIQERYAHLKMTDPARQKMNTEVMNLYREKGVNPAAGCVPMLLTFPVLLAFYSLLSQAIELRGAEFGFWIHDLSQKDPYYVTPLLMGATMFWQQWLAPTSADPMQQRMMLIMPVVFTVLFLGFPSGLAIYYLVSNLFQISQQYFTNRTLGPPPGVQPPRPAAERRVKKVGSGRTAGAEGRS
jgi:YidC/Oxa1 family membrane protein insertase